MLSLSSFKTINASRRGGRGRGRGSSSLKQTTLDATLISRRSER